MSINYSIAFTVLVRVQNHSNHARFDLNFNIIRFYFSMYQKKCGYIESKVKMGCNPVLKNRIDEMLTYYDGRSKLAVIFFLLNMKLLPNSVVQLGKAFDVLILTSKLTRDFTLFLNISNAILSFTLKFHVLCYLTL